MIQETGDESQSREECLEDGKRRQRVDRELTVRLKRGSGRDSTRRLYARP